MDLASDVATEVREHVKQAGYSTVSGLQDFGGEFIRQLVGGIGGNKQPQTSQQIAQSKKKDDDFSDAAYLETRARVQAIYDEHRAKVQREEQAKQQQTAQQLEEKKFEELNSKRTTGQDVAVAMGKGSAETGRNYGSE